MRLPARASKWMAGSTKVPTNVGSPVGSTLDSPLQAVATAMKRTNACRLIRRLPDGCRLTVPLQLRATRPPLLNSTFGCPPSADSTRAELAPVAPVSCKRGLGGNHILTLDKAAGVLPRRDVPENDVALEWAKSGIPSPRSTGMRVIMRRWMSPA